ncbi:MAG TPA: hypothetical protein VG055_07890, partial [Planctomycetaceae bacterium]|nr:hypothetical protein [Planctomycetaceae bacterium]
MKANCKLGSWSRVLILFALLLAQVAAPRAARAQTSKAATGTKSAAKTDTAAAAAAPAAGDRFPPNPVQFYRGNAPPPQDGSSVGVDVGEYLSRVALILFLGLLAAWTFICRFVDEDSRGLKVRPEFWNSVFVLTGVVGFLIALASPLYVVGVLSVLLTCGVPFGFYVQERNRRVPESSKILTPQHIRGVVHRWAARLGIKLGRRDGGDEGAGPPIEFIGKSDASGKGDRSRTRQVENSKGYMAAKELVYDAILRRSTDIHLEPKEDEMSVRLRIDGVMYPTEPFDRVVGDAVM